MGIIDVKKVRPHKKRGYWFYLRRVPAKFRAFDNRAIIFLSTGIRIVDDPCGTAARVKVAEINSAIEQRWNEQATGIHTLAVARYERAVAEASRLGFPYRTNADLFANATMEEIRHRILAALQSDNSFEALIATMGGEEIPRPAPPNPSRLETTPRRRT